MLRSVRSRITWAATAMVALALLAASVLIVRTVESDLLAATERALSAELELEATRFLTEGPQLFEFNVQQQDLALGVFIEDEGLAIGSIFNPQTGEPVSDVVIDTVERSVIQLSEPLTGMPISDPEIVAVVESLNFDFRTVDSVSGNVLLVGAVARDEVDNSLAALRRALLIIVPLLALAMGLIIWWLVGRALRPVRAMSDHVEAISTSSLDQRVPVPPGSDEISGLATVMNSMLTRLQRGDVRQQQFAADASHELRSPLSTVRAAAEILERSPGSARAPELAGDIVAEADRMDALIGDLLTLSRVDDEQAGFRHGEVDLSSIAAAIGDVELAVEPDVTVHGEAGQIERALENLVTNAKRHAVDRVLVRLMTIEHEDALYAQLSVSDDGQGVPTEMRQTIFERFRRLDEARSRDGGGSGLGLSLVQAIVARHRGTITVDDSTELGGARFTIHLPLTVLRE